MQIKLIFTRKILQFQPHFESESFWTRKWPIPEGFYTEFKFYTLYCAWDERKELRIGKPYHSFSWEQYLISHPHLPQVRNFSRVYNKT